MTNLVPGRECGECTICCRALQIDEPELQKHAAVVCPNCVSGGCGIYQTRPKVCREFYCGWRAMEWLDDEWRPDKSGVLIVGLSDEVPEAYRNKSGVQLVIGYPKAIYKKDFAITVAKWVANRVPVFLAIPVPVGFQPRAVFLNPKLEDAVARDDLDAFMDVMQDMLRALASQEFQPATFTSAPVSFPAE